jgi:hypothetical protein
MDSIPSFVNIEIRVLLLHLQMLLGRGDRRRGCDILYLVLLSQNHTVYNGTGTVSTKEKH